MTQGAGEPGRPDDLLSEQIIGACIEIHRSLGPGLLESAYEECLCHELSLRGIRFRRQVPVPVDYKGVLLDCCYRLDVLVEERIVVELKAVENLSPLHTAQTLTYLKLTGLGVALLINFNVPLLKQGLRRLTYQKNSSDLPGSPAPCEEPARVTTAGEGD
jgi:GxxExxY protein